MRRPFLVGLGLALALVALAAALPSLRARLSGGAPSVATLSPSPAVVAPPSTTVAPATPPGPASPPDTVSAPDRRTLKAVGKPRLDAQIRKVVESIDRSGQPPKSVAQGGHRGSQRAVFQNLEGRLPAKAPAYYRETDVWPRGAGDRGPERLVFGREGEVYYTRDHYRSFVRLR